jgi:hypothetical protein
MSIDDERDRGNGMGLQGEFGIGLLSFWTVGHILTMTSTGADQRTYQMTMRKGDPRYDVSPKCAKEWPAPAVPCRAHSPG